MMYGKGIYRILRVNGGWCVAKISAAGDRWHAVSNIYSYRGWAQNFARRMKLHVVNYESQYV
jgi:hypothetical protein